MKKQLFVLGVVTLVALLATTAFAANRGVSFKGIGFIHPWDPGPYAASMVWGMTDDGSILLTSPSWSGSYATLTTWPDLEWTLVGGTASMKMSGDGSIIMGSYLNGEDGYNHAGSWNGAEDDWTLIPIPDGFVPCDYTATSLHGMSANGECATGLTWTESCRARPFLWERATNTTVMLPSLNDESSRGNQPTADCSMVIGFNQKANGWRRGAMWVNGTPEWIDGLGQNEAKICSADGSGCSWDPDCPDFVDAYCDNAGSCDKTGVACVDHACVGGPNPGNYCYNVSACYGYCSSGPSTGDTCRYDSDCPSTCVNGPNHGQPCTSSYYCPDDPVCIDNPDYNGEDEKGEAYIMTSDGQYIAGVVYGQSDWNDPNYDPYLWASGYRKNPDGSFTQLLPPEGVYPDGEWVPYDMTDEASKIVGKFGSWWESYPVLWSEETGTLDFQYFLVSQGLDDLFFWYLGPVTSINADGTMVGGYGYNYANPDCPSQWGCTEGFVSDIAKAAVCHKDDLPAERTLTVSWDSLGNHLGHGDQLGTCEFWEGGGARAADMRPDQNRDHVPPEIDHRQETQEQVQARRGVRFGEQYAPETRFEADDPSSIQGPAVQHEDARKRVRRSR